MQLKAADLVAVKSTGLLPVFGYALLAALLFGWATGGWVAWKWKSGAAAINENRELRADAAEWKRIAEEQRQINTDNTLAFKAATERLGAIAQGREDDRQAIQQFLDTQRNDLQAFFDANPLLRSLDAGPDILRHWNKANAGPAPEPATAEPASKPGAGMPAASPGTRQPAAAAGHEPRRSDGAVSRLPQQQEAADRRHQGMGSHGLAVVLHRRPADRHRRGRMPA